MTTYITCKGRNDGIGAQACGIISIMVAAKAFGLKYVHTPMKFVAHYPFPNPSLNELKFWTKAWEELLNFRFTHELLENTPGKRIHLDRKSMESYFDNQIFQKETVYSTRDLHTIVTKYRDQESISDAWDKILPIIREGYSRDRNVVPHFVKDRINIAVHIRRGDSTNNKRRFVEHDYFVNILKSIIDQLTERELDYTIQIYSEGCISDFPEFQEFTNLTFRLNDDHLDTLHHMICSDILVMSKSTFSYLPALLNRNGIIIYKPFWLLPPKPLEKNWIIAKENGECILDL